MRFYVGKESINESNIVNNGGVIIIKGKKLEDGTQRLYVTTVSNVSELNRLKKDNSDGKPAKMVKINKNIARISVQDGRLKANYVSWSSDDALNKALNITQNSIVLNNNKTPLWWETLSEKNIQQAINKNQHQILNIAGIRWTN